MSYGTPALAEFTLVRPIQEATYHLLEISNSRRDLSRELQLEQALTNNQKDRELAVEEAKLNAMRDQRPDIQSSQYDVWMENMTQVREDYQMATNDIQDYYDEINSMLEADANEKEIDLDQDQTTTETQLEAMQAEKEGYDEAISQKIEEGAIFSN